MGAGLGCAGLSGGWLTGVVFEEFRDQIIKVFDGYRTPLQLHLPFAQ